MHRRHFLGSLGVLALAAARRKTWADHRVVSAQPLVVEFDLGSLKGRYTPVEDFYIRNHFDAPASSGPASLTIDGEVQHPMQFALEDLKNLPFHGTGAVLECAGNPVSGAGLASDGVWQGWRLEDVIARARPRSSASHLHLYGRDGFSRSVPLGRAIHGGMIATALNHLPLGRNHGAPCRALFPGWYGMDSVKWLERIVVATVPLPAAGNTYLELRRRDSGGVDVQPLPRVQVKSVVARPEDNAVLQRGLIKVEGVAWSGCGRISNVEVSVDGGTRWQSARVSSSMSPYDWVLWTVTLDLKRQGVVEFVSRASDSSGNVQPMTRDPQRLDRYAYNVCQRIRCAVV